MLKRKREGLGITLSTLAYDANSMRAFVSVIVRGQTTVSLHAREMS
jgi:hypothetical protein